MQVQDGWVHITEVLLYRQCLFEDIFGSPYLGWIIRFWSESSEKNLDDQDLASIKKMIRQRAFFEVLENEQNETNVLGRIRKTKHKQENQEILKN